MERSYPVAPAVVEIWMPNEHWNFLLGAGGEFAKEGSFFLNRASVEYKIPIPKRWEFFAGLGYDFKWKAYDTWTITFGFAENFGKE